MMKKQTEATVIGIIAIAILSLLVSDDADAAKNVRYECSTYSGEHVLTLPVGTSTEQLAPVRITFHGDPISGVYERTGLTQY